MMRFAFLLFVIFLCIPAIAKADYFLWQEPETGLTATFPDTWKRQNNRNPIDKLTIAGPSGGENPVCTIKVTDDKRFTIYPADLGESVQRVAVSRPFWESYLGLYDDYTLERVYDGAGFGRWLASYAFASYARRNGTAYEQRRALLFASLYYDKLYILECSTLNHGFENWQKNFQSIMKSVDFKKVFHERATGDYHDFLKDVDLNFWAQTGPDGTTKY